MSLDDSSINLNQSYAEASARLRPEAIERNHSLLDHSIQVIELPIDKCESPEVYLTRVVRSIFWIPPEDLHDPSEQLLKDIKNDINFIKESYESVAEKTNDCIDLTNSAMKNLYQPSRDIKKEISIIRDKFEKSIISLSEPLLAEEKGIQNNFNTSNLLEEDKKQVDLEKEKIKKNVEKFKDECDKLIIEQKKIFEALSGSVENFSSIVCGLQTPIQQIRDKIEKYCIDIERYLEIFNEMQSPQETHDNIIKIKKPLEGFLEEVKEIKESSERKIQELKTDFVQKNLSVKGLQEDNKNKINTFQKNKDKICDSINGLREKYHQSKLNYENKKIELIDALKITEQIETSISTVVEVSITNISGGLGEVKEVVESKIKEMKMDLLFIMDLTGSMDPYVNQVKEKMILIIENIQKKCLGVEIYVGFVGYRDIIDYQKGYFGEEIDFTDFSDSEKQKNTIDIIKAIEVFGGGDTCEDLTGGLYTSLNLKWKNRARYAILITDAPCHGRNYHNNEVDSYPNGDPKGRDPLDLVEKMFKKGISLFCIKITEKTDILYNKFEDIYQREKYKGSKSEFQIYDLSGSDPEKLGEIIIKSATKVYKDAREECLLNSCRV